MKVKWLGHASFLITAKDGTRILTDPFGDFPGLSYRPIQETAEIVVVSHNHGDHVGAKLKGSYKTVTGRGRKKVGSIEFSGVETYHDTSKGRERGPNTVFCFPVDGVRVCHMGDLGHELSKTETAEIGQVDVLMIPVAGFYTIDAATAGRVCDQVRPRVVLPMHYRNDKCDFPITGVDEFLKGKDRVKHLDSTEVELKSGQLPGTTEIWVLKHAL